MNKETLNKVTGFSAICYNAQRNQYAALPKNSSNFLILNADFEPVRMIGCSATGYLNQGIECKGDYIFRALSPKKRGQRQAVAVYDWEGKYYGRIDLATGYELETIFFSGNKMYAGLYRSYYKTTYKTVVTEKKVKVKGKKKKQLKKVKEKIPVTKLVRDNYIAKVKTF